MAREDKFLTDDEKNELGRTAYDTLYHADPRYLPFAYPPLKWDELSKEAREFWIEVAEKVIRKFIGD